MGRVIEEWGVCVWVGILIYMGGGRCRWEDKLGMHDIRGECSERG